VLKLAIGSIELVNGTTAQGNRAFLLKLNDIALKFLGLLKLPPGGSTSFYLFGNPEQASNQGGLGWYAAYNKDDGKISE
jgi:hypothetical protein